MNKLYNIARVATLLVISTVSAQAACPFQGTPSDWARCVTGELVELAADLEAALRRLATLESVTTDVPTEFQNTNGVAHTEVMPASNHYHAARTCASMGASLCGIADWAVIDDARDELAVEELTWVDGLDAGECPDVSCTTGLRMTGHRATNAYVQQPPVDCADRCDERLRFRCCL